MGHEVVRVYGLPPLWGCPSPSPFVIKVLTWLRMANVPHELVALRRPPRSASGKIPYVDRPDGSVLSDSQRIIHTLATERDVDLDGDLSPADRATAHLLRRTIEESLYFAGLYERFATPEGFAAVRVGYFRHVPWPLRALAPLVIRRQALKNLWGQGTGRRSRADVAEGARADLRALAASLGSRRYFLGDRPHTIDATAFAFLWGMSSVPFESALRTELAAHENLVAYVKNGRAEWFADAT